MYIYLIEEFKENFNGVFKVIKDNIEFILFYFLIGEEIKKLYLFWFK